MTRLLLARRRDRLAGCAHNAHLEMPDLFNPILADILLADRSVTPD